ncbi:MAG: hypothetical protein WKF59_08970 [Chitinophagaceae bacterium]
MGQGVFGTEAAAKKYFNKNAKNLSRSRSSDDRSYALPNPKIYTIKPISPRVAARYPWIVRTNELFRERP